MTPCSVGESEAVVVQRDLMMSIGACDAWRVSRSPTAWDLPAAEHRDVSGVVVDIPTEGGFATVVGLTDNTTSLYTSTGGGTIGAGEHREVAAGTHRLLSAVQAQLESFKRQDDSYKGTNVKRGTTYYYKVTAVNAAGESPLSNEASATAP